jgi:hypothetical protein
MKALNNGTLLATLSVRVYVVQSQVVHGTDTMAYTASALSIMLSGFGKPIIMTGSQVCVFVLFSLLTFSPKEFRKRRRT